MLYYNTRVCGRLAFCCTHVFELVNKDYHSIYLSINPVEVIQLVDLTELLKHHLVKECVTLFNFNDTCQKTQQVSSVILRAICSTAGTLYFSHYYGS